LVVALVGSNVFWLAKIYTSYDIGTQHLEWERRTTADAARGALALIPVVAGGRTSKADIVEALRKADDRWVPQDRGNITYIAGLALEFSADGKLTNVTQTHSICC
jgi:hypothetical protein